MKTSIALLITIVLAAGQLYGQTEPPPPIPTEEQPEVLTRGPVHEAFAEPVNLQVEAGLIVPDEPPASIEEIPPDDRPVGEQFVWVPGYWAWDGERNIYIWVSGCWRAVPPRMYWMPGYWAKTPGGWQWVAGFWAPVVNTEIEYLSAPPVLQNVEPPGPPPYPDRIWVPPCWYWHQGQYIRRPGYWIVAQQDWIWVPSHYVWTPRGYVFVVGHWDYTLQQRGLLFAPVYFPRHFHNRPRFSYSLSVVVDFGNLQFGLFTYPRYNHYYFGDYYDDFYVSIGIYPRYECVRRYTWYDPIYVNDRWRNHRIRSDWDDYERHEYDRRRSDRDLRPARTYREMETRLAKLPEKQRKTVRTAEPMTTVILEKTTTLKFERNKTDTRKKFSARADDVHKFRDERSQWESKGESHRTVQPIVEQKGPVTPQPQRRETERQPTEQRRQKTPPAERREAERQPTEQRRQETPPAEHKEIAPPTERKGPEIKPSERRKSAPAERKEITPPPTKEKPATASPREGERREPEHVKIPTPPVVGKQGGIFKKGPPSPPPDEQKAEVKDSRKEKDTRGEKETRSGKGERKKDD